MILIIKALLIILHYSESGKIKHVVPQGSILGLLFFVLYNNDLPNIKVDPLKLILFADDTSIIITKHRTSKFKETFTI